MNRNKLIGIAVIGGGLVWYMNSQSSTLPAVTTTTSTIANTDGSTTTTNDDGSTTTNTDGSTTTTDADGTVIETTETPEIDTTEGSDDANTTADCSKYRASQHEKEKVWMSSAKVNNWTTTGRRPKGIKMDDFTTSQEQYFINQEVDWSLKLSVKNTSKDQCGEKKYSGIDKKCWLPPGKDGGAYGNDCCLKWTVTWTNPQGETYVDDSGTITRPDIKPKDGGPVWSTLNGKFRIPNVESSEGTWDVAIKYWWNDDNFTPMPSVSWEGQVYSVVPESCGALAEQAAETYKSEFTRPVFRPRISRQSFMQF